MATVNLKPRVDINWDNLTFSVIPTRSMYYATCDLGEEWVGGELVPYNNISISPAAGVLSYGQGIFEGTKAFRSIKGRTVLFRPEKNGERFYHSAERLCIPPVPHDLFLESIEEVVRDNEDYIPPSDIGSLYIRPLLWGTGVTLGVKPATSYTYVVFVTPVGPYFKGGLHCIKLMVTKSFHRSAPKGLGGSKTLANYAASLYPLTQAKEKGFDEVIYLNSSHDEYIEEMGGANIFLVKGNILKTPRLTGSILPGVTRDSVITIGKEMFHLDVIETDVTVEDLLNADEVFCTGTAAVITPVGKISVDGAVTDINHNEIGSWARKFFDTLTGIQLEKIEDPFGWVKVVL